MKRTIGETVVATGLMGILLVSSAQSTSPETLPRAGGSQQEQKLATDHTKSLGNYAIAKTKGGEVAQQKKPQLPLAHYPVSKLRQQQLQHNAQYVSSVLAPALSKPTSQAEHLAIVKPIHTKNDPVNIPGQFIVTADHTCGSQFVINTTDKPGLSNISVSVFGKLDVLRDGQLYGSAAYTPHSGIAHTEGLLNAGVDFRDSQPAPALAYVHKINAKFCG